MKIYALNSYVSKSYTRPYSKHESVSSEQKHINEIPQKFINIPFAGLVYMNQIFEQEYPRSFFRKLLDEGLPCAYTGIKMIPKGDIDKLVASGIFKKPSSVCVPVLSEYKQSLQGVEKRVLTYLEKASVKYPNYTIQELLQLGYPDAERALIARQSVVLNQLNLMSRDLPQEEHKKVRELVNNAFDLIFQQNPIPETRFRRKNFIYELEKLKFSDAIQKEKFINIAEKLPQSSDSVNSFIVKYSQPYKIKYDKQGNIIKVKRNSEEIGKRLLDPSSGSDEHIYPQKLYKQEELARQCGDEDAEDLSDTRVTILTTAYINALKSDTLIDKFIKTSKYDIPKNIQKHVDRLIEIDKKWFKCGRISDAEKLSKYIMLLKEEFERRSEIVKVDTKSLDELLNQVKDN